MKGVFEKNFDFFCKPSQQDQGICEYPPKKGGDIGQKVAKL